MSYFCAMRGTPGYMVNGGVASEVRRGMVCTGKCAVIVSLREQLLARPDARTRKRLSHHFCPLTMRAPSFAEGRETGVTHC